MKLEVSPIFNSPVEQMDKHYIYINNTEEVDPSLINSLDYELTIPLAEDFDLKEKIKSQNMTPYYIKINDLQFLKETSSELVDLFQKKRESNEFIMEYELLNNYNAKMISKMNPKNDLYSIDKILVGNYPLKANEVLIPESIAIAMANKDNLSNYQSILGKKIELQVENPNSDEEVTKRKFVVSGIYKGSNKLIINPPNQKQAKDVQKNYVIKFDKLSDRDKFIKNNVNLDILVNKSRISLSSAIKAISTLIVITLSLLIISKETLVVLRRFNLYKMYYKSAYVIAIIIVYFTGVILIMNKL